MINRARVLALVLTFAAASGAAHADPIPPPPQGAPPPPLEVDHPFAGPLELLFISPAGEPFRASVDADYPVTVWFARADKNSDGALSVDEFVADALAFFDVLDTDKDGLVDGFENVEYEKVVAPEILGVMRRPDRSRGEGRWSLFSREPKPERSRGGRRATGPQGAAQYGLLNEPHPVRGADANLDGKVSRAEAEATAGRRFRLLDLDGDGRLTLATLPKTPAQIVADQTLPVPPGAERRKR